ncbi:MAG TPA: phage portal protein [Chitinophagaceae bacterium]|nr:phage portal protein [Chitinophagaceae bacterium]
MNIIDRTIALVSPKTAMRRVANRAKAQMIDMHTRRYEGGAYGHRHSGFHVKVDQSPNELIHQDLKNLVTRSRYLSINNPYAKRAPKIIANNVVGTGILPTPVGEKEEVDRINAAWRSWGESLECDFNGDFNFYGLQKLIMRTIVISGEALIIRKRVKSDISRLGIQLLVLEGDYIDQTKHNYWSGGYGKGHYDYYGIRYNEDNKKTGYWIYDRHPLEGNIQSSFVPIEDIIHIFEVERSGQNRGVPFSSSTILKQRDLDDYEDAEILGKKAASCMPIFVTNNDLEGSSNGFDDKVEHLEPGTINYLKPGESVSFAQPPQNPGFSEFIKTQHRAIANGYGVTYEQLTGDLSNVNFSSARLGWIEFQRMVDDWQYLLIIPKFCEKAYKWFLEACRIALGTRSDVQVNWTAPRREMIDPVKEINGMKNMVRAGFTSWQEVVKQQGYNPEEVLRELREDQKKFMDAGLMPEWSQFFETMAMLEVEKEKTARSKYTSTQQ